MARQRGADMWISKQTNEGTALGDAHQHAVSGLGKMARWAIQGSPSNGGALGQDLRDAGMRLQELMCYYRCAIREVETKFRVLDEQFSLERDRNPISSIQTRLKSYDSIYEKACRTGIAPGIESLERNMHDIAGVRIICAFQEDVYQLADCLGRQDDVVILGRKDYIENPKPSGYRSLHLIVEVPIFLAECSRRMKVEIQLRTIAMEFWASLEHRLRYKKDIDPELLKATSDALWQCAELSAELDAKMQNVRHMIDGFQLLSNLEDQDHPQ